MIIFGIVMMKFGKEISIVNVLHAKWCRGTLIDVRQTAKTRLYFVLNFQPLLGFRKKVSVIV